MKPVPFMGNNDEVFQLSDGSFWQVKYEYEYLYEYYPNVVICPSQNVLMVDSKKLNVARLSNSGRSSNSEIIESNIDGEFEGWDGETIVRLLNGQIWEQARYHYDYQYAYNPEVLIYKVGHRYMMQVEGADEPVQVRRIK